MTELAELLACPRCDKTPLDTNRKWLHCKACKVDFPRIADIPWLFAEPDASLGEWRSRLHMAMQKIAKDLAAIDAELSDAQLRALSRQRCERHKSALLTHKDALTSLLAPVGPQLLSANFDTYLALRTRLPSDHGLHTYYANVHRDWAWGDEENTASLQQITHVLGDNKSLGRTLVLGAGAGRLAYDIHTQLDTELTVALDFNPMLLLVAQKMIAGEALELHEFPIAPHKSDDEAVLRTLKAPGKSDDRLHLLFGDALRAPVAKGAFDTVVTPWLIDVITEDLPVFARRINTLLKTDGRWINFGSLAFNAAERSKRYGPEEVTEIVEECGFATPVHTEATIPYMNSPASRHGRLETVFSFAASKSGKTSNPPRHRALPDWIVTGKEAVPLNPSFRTQAMTTQIYAFTMSLIDGKRSINEMAEVFEQQRLMPKEEAVHAIRGFLIRMFDDAGRGEL